MSTTEPLFEGHTREIDTTSKHFIEWVFDQDAVIAKAVCESGPDANCHQYSTCDCESWVVERDETGAAYHLAWDEDAATDEEIEARHPMRSGDDCNVCEWLNSSDPTECASFPGTLLIAQTAIKPTWQGDYFDWSPLTITDATTQEATR